MSLIQRYRAARAKRLCPKCQGTGSDIFDTILKHNFRERPCSLCGGEGWVRYGRRVAFQAARAGSLNHPVDEATRLPDNAYPAHPAIEGSVTP